MVLIKKFLTRDAKDIELSELGKLYYSVMDSICEIDKTPKFKRPKIKILKINKHGKHR